MENPKTLLFFVFPIKFFLSHRLPIAQKAIQFGYKVHLISTPGLGEDILKKEGIIFHPIEITRSDANLVQEIKTIYKLFSLYKEIKPDIVHHITIKPILYGTLVARLVNINAIVNAFSGLGHVFTANGLKIKIIRNFIQLAYRVILRHQNMVSIVQNNDDMIFLQKKSIIKKHQTVLIEGSGVDLNKFQPTAEPLDTPVVILPARLLKDKGVVEFVEAAIILSSKELNIKMVLVGDVDSGNPSSVTQQEIKAWTKSNIIEHWGYSSNMCHTFKKANIVCLPSYREGLPKSLIEAAAAGRAIITTDVPGCREMIDNKAPNGILVPAQNSAELAEAIADLIMNKHNRLQMAKNGRKLAEKKFSIELVVSKTMKIYKALLY